MTSRQIYEAVLIELNKNNAPSLRLHEFNYLFNKAINEFVDETYAQYDTTQAITDSLRVLQSETTLTPEKIKVSFDILPNVVTNIEGIPTIKENQNDDKQTFDLSGANYQVFLPEDYLHLLNCTCIYQVLKQNKCYNAGDFVQIPATKLTSDSWSTIMTDVYNRPSPMKPYYYLHNRNYQQNMPTNSYVPEPTNENSETNTKFKGSSQGNDVRIVSATADFTNKTTKQVIHICTYDDISNTITGSTWYEVGTNKLIGRLGTHIPLDSLSNLNRNDNVLQPFSRTINLNNYQVSVVEKPAAVRFANPQQVRMEIRYGRDDSVYRLVAVVVDYVKAPQFIRLTQDEIDLTSDTSQIMEYPDFVCQKIINKLVALLLERSSDPRLTTNVQINRTMVSPAQPQSTQN